MLLEGSRDAQPGAWPWIVSIQQVWHTGIVHVCGGSLIRAQWVLTAAHCFVDARNVPMWRVLVGVTHLAHDGPEVQVCFVRQILVHEGYNNVSQKNDIALVELEKPVHCSPYVQTACVPDASLRVWTLTKCYVSGWEANSARFSGSPLVLQEAQVHLIDAHACNRSSWYSGTIHTHNLCAGFPPGGTNTCQGDSGGPLVCKDPHADYFWLVGVTSWGKGCSRTHRPGIYTSTQKFYKWILAQMG
ncbi:ACRO protein, partial [Centropus unirufus]|nr:ACRO protein [Centropus unirufus]